MAAPKWHAVPFAEIEAIAAREVASGGHVPGLVRSLCLRCGNWCDGIYYGKEGVPDQCKACWEETSKAGTSVDASISKAYLPASDRERYGSTMGQRVVQYKAEARPYRPTLADVLLLWASEHAPAPFAAYAERRDAVWEARVLAALVRQRGRDDPEWVAALAAHPNYGADLLEIGKYVKTAGGYPIDPSQTFCDWVRSVRQCELGEVYDGHNR